MEANEVYYMSKIKVALFFRGRMLLTVYTESKVQSMTCMTNHREIKLTAPETSETFVIVLRHVY